LLSFVKIFRVDLLVDTSDAGTTLKAQCDAFCETTDGDHEFCQSGLSKGVIVAIVLGSIFLLALIFVMVCYVVIRPKSDEEKEAST
jgi:hypothetical protein